MSAIEKAKQIAKERDDAVKERQEEERRRAEAKERAKVRFAATIDRVAKEFNGVNGIVVERTGGHRQNEWILTRRGNIIARVELSYQTWEESYGDDGGSTESGYAASIDYYPPDSSKHCKESCHYEHYFEDSFARIMSSFL